MGLVTVEASSSIVRLVHFTLQEHLSIDPTIFHNPHSTVGEVCLTYLIFGCIRNLSPTLYYAPKTSPFLEYTSVYWGRHTRRGLTENIKILALRLLDRFDEHISAQLLLLGRGRDGGARPYFGGTRGPMGCTGLHGVAFLRIAGLVCTVLDMKESDVNSEDCTSMTALTWASRGGHDEVVKMLLEREDVNPNLADTKYCQTPLSWASENGRSGAVKILLEREDVNPNQANSKYSWTPFLWAAKKGYEGIFKMLLERKGVDPNQAGTEYERTPLSWAAEKGHEAIVEMLLGRKDIHSSQVETKSGRRPLLWAAQKGHEGIAKMLLKREDVDLN